MPRERRPDRGAVRSRVRGSALLSALVAACAALALGCGGPEDGASAPDDAREEGGAAAAETPAASSEGAASTGGDSVHVVYVPAYSHIYHGSEGEAYQLTTTLSVRNTDPERPITLRSVRYYDTRGEIARRFLDEPRRLGPLGTVGYVVEEADTTGGSGANFIVEWSSEEAVSPPVIEAVMISTRSGRGVSFTSRGVTIERPPR